MMTYKFQDGRFTAKIHFLHIQLLANSYNPFDADKTKMIRLPHGEKIRQYVKPFLSNTGTLRTNRQTDGHTDIIAILISRVSVLTRDKNLVKYQTQLNSKITV